MSARDYALLELDRKRLPHWPARLARTAPHRQAPLDPRDLRLAEQIEIGVVKNLLLLQHLIAHYAGRALKSIDPLAQKILAIGLFQLRFLARIPESAAVNEAVEQAKRFGRGRAAGFINAVLRKATRQPPPPLPDAKAEPARFAEIALSHPRELFEKLVALAGVEQALCICHHNNAEPPTIVRLFSGRSEADLRAAGIEVAAHEQPGMFIVRPQIAILAQWAQQGIAQVQDPAAAGVVPRLGIQGGQRLLDRCCGLGTKTLQMRDILGPEGSILAVDPSAHRCRILRELVERRGITNVVVAQAGMLAEIEPQTKAPFDRILVDVPCSNSGVLARRPEARYAQDRLTIESLRRLQNRILDDTASHLRSDGTLVYSTCSIWPEENQDQIGAFLTRHPDYRLIEQQTMLPSADSSPQRYHDGGYVAVLTRR
jgi:16S rRNA (cytosine967-C5)-methyltransferase